MKQNKTCKTKKLTEKEKIFALAYVSNGRVATKAAVTAGYKEKAREVSSYRLIRNPLIQDEIKRLDNALRKKLNVNRETLAKEYDDAILMAKESNNINAIVSAINGKSKLFGYDVKKLEHAGNITISDLIDDEDEDIQLND